MSARSLSRAKSRISDGVGGGRFDLLGELVPDLEGPRTLGNVDDEKEFGDQQCFEGGDPEVLQPFADADATVKSLGSPEITIERARSASTMPRRKPPFFAWITVPCELDRDVWVENPSDFR